MGAGWGWAINQAFDGGLITGQYGHANRYERRAENRCLVALEWSWPWSWPCTRHDAREWTRSGQGWWESDQPERSGEAVVDGCEPASLAAMERCK